MINKAKPFVKWVGGKTQLLESIENTLHSDFSRLNDVTYIEPFVGGGAVLFWILQKYPNIKKAIINDINPDLTGAYKTIKEKPFELVDLLGTIQEDYLILTEEKRKEYYLSKREIFNTKSLQPIENTAIFIFLNRTCFNGLYRVNSKGLFNVPFGSYKNPKICDEKTILADSELLNQVNILTGDFENTLQYTTSNTLFYLDPPYKPLSATSSFNSYAKEEFDDNDQIRLRDFCTKIDKLGHSFILSNSDVKSKNPNDDFFDVLYDQFKINRVFATRMVNANPDKRGKLKELLITNLDNDKYIKSFILPKKNGLSNKHIKHCLTTPIKVLIDSIKTENNFTSTDIKAFNNIVNKIVEDFKADYWEPIIVDKELYVIDGKLRLEAAKMLNLKYIDVVIHDS